MRKILILALPLINQIKAGQLKSKIQLSDAEKQKILFDHNRYRQLIAAGQVARMPRATNMKQMRWDNDLWPAKNTPNGAYGVTQTPLNLKPETIFTAKIYT